ncbi:MAG: HIG1 domain-containing protein [Gemmataceae bacterium]
MFHSLDVLVVCSAIGIGFITAGLGILFSKSRYTLAVLLATISIVTTLVSLWVSVPAAMAEVLLLCGGALVYGLIRLRRKPAYRSVKLFLMRPFVAGIVLAVTGMGIVLAGSWRYDWMESNTPQDQMMRMMSYASWHPPFDETTVEGKTDKGKTIPLYVAQVRSAEETAADELELLTGFEWLKRVINRGAASDASNCHGWVFTGGKYWVQGKDVRTILEDNGYRVTRNPRPEDLIVYFKANESGTETVEHTGIVRAVGGVTLIESKWGWMGVYLHAADSSCYGLNFKFYHTSRSGHQFVNLKPEDAEPSARPRSRFGTIRRLDFGR